MSTSRTSTDPRRVAVAVGFALLGLVVILLALLWQGLPDPRLLLLFMLTTAFFEWRSVEVNDRLLLSGSVMVCVTAGVVFGESAVLAMVLVNVGGTFQRADWQQRRWFQPAANFGQLAVTGAGGGLVLSSLAPETVSPTVAGLLHTVGASLGAAMVMALLSAALVSWIVRMAFPEREIRPWSGMPLILARYLAMGTVGGLLGAAYLEIGPETYPLLLAVFFIAQLAASSYADLREAHEATMRGFIKALEAKDMFTHGHTGRVASFSRMIGQELGWSADRLEQIRWAALLHDVGTLAVPRDLLRNRDKLTSEEGAQVMRNTETVEAVLSESEFLAPLMERASRRRVLFSEAPEDDVTRDAQVIAVAKEFDYVTSGKAHSHTVSQDVALSDLRADSPYRYDPEVVAALEAALAKAGGQYGAVEGRRRLTREDLSKQAMYDR